MEWTWWNRTRYTTGSGQDDPLPGQVEADVLQSIQFLPGVSSPNGELSQLYIRGGALDQNLILGKTFLCTMYPLFWHGQRI